jgi:hypothetical protein
VAYGEDLADRVSAVLAAEAVTERQMFGGLPFMLGGHMFCGIVQDTLMVRLGLHGPALQEWIDAASVFARTSPPKPARGTASRKRR